MGSLPIVPKFFNYVCYGYGLHKVGAVVWLICQLVPKSVVPEFLIGSRSGYVASLPTSFEIEIMSIFDGLWSNLPVQCFLFYGLWLFGSRSR